MHVNKGPHLNFLTALSAGLLAGLIGVTQAAAQETGLPLPRFVSLSSDEVNMRTGPGVRYPVQWVFQRRNFPVEVIAEYDTWRKIRDVEGAEGWVHRAMLTSRRSILVKGEEVTLRQSPSEQSPAVARLSDGIVATIETCDMTWCRVSTSGYLGWVQRRAVWGLYEAEVVE